MAFALLTWQPLLLSIGPRLLFLFKLCGAAAIGLSLVTRARELAGEGQAIDSHAGQAPATATAQAAA